YREKARPEGFHFGDVYRSVQINQVTWRTVGLVFGDGIPVMCPCRPRLGKFFQQQFRQGLPVVRFYAAYAVRAIGREQLAYMQAQVIPPPSLERFIQALGPVGPVYLVAIVVECPYPQLSLAERLVEASQVMLQRRFRKMVERKPFATRCGPFHLLAGFASKHRIEFPLAGPRRPV